MLGPGFLGLQRAGRDRPRMVGFVEAIAMSAQTSIAHYRIVAKLGEGGMGAVYRATDTKLNRDVAIKVLPDSFLSDSGRVARFQREAQVLAALNHPHIGSVYGIEENAIVMELVEGSNLKGPLPVETVIDYARQIAAGLEAAHEKGIIHRDLKPANIRVTPDGRIKLLDFGLAKASTASAALPEGANRSECTTLTGDMTHYGAILGTPAYMSPEQAQGKPLDKRSDIWSFGVVLYELLTGRHPFATREAGIDVLTAIVTREPDFTCVPADARALRLLRRCLQKDPMLRLRDIGDVRILLDDAELAPPLPPRRRWLTWAACAVAIASLGAAGVAWIRPAQTDSGYGTTRFSIPLPPGAAWPQSATSTQYVPSPDGRYLAMVATMEGKDGLWLRPFDSPLAHLLEHTEAARTPFWSPDGKWIGFFTGDQIRRVAASGGDVLPVCNLAHGQGSNGATWSRDGFIIFSAGPGPLRRVPVAGGAPEPVTSLAKGEQSHQWPQLLPGERELLYFAKAPQGSPENAIYIQNLASGKRDRIIQSGTRALWSPPGYLLFTQDQNLMAQPLNLSSHRLSGQPVTIAKDVSVNEPNGRSTIAASLNGVLAYRSSLGLDRRLVWHDRNGKAISTVARAGPYRQPVLSPNGATLAILSGSSSSSQDLWTIDLASGATTELTFDRHLDPNNFPVWSPDSRSVAVSPQGGGIEVVTVASADVRVLSKDPIVVQDWSPDGRSILCTDIQEHHVLLAPVDRPQEPKTIITSPLAQWGFHFAPGGAAVVYITSESGDQSAYVASFPSFAEKRRVSPGTAAYPVWNANGRLYYSSGGSIWEVEIRTAPHLGVGQPRALFPSAYGRFAVAAGAQKFLTLDPLQDQREELMIIQNWAVGMNRP